MGFRQGTYARVFSAENKGNYSVCSLSVSKKKKDSNEYEVDFQDGFVRFIGQAHEAISNMNIPDKKGVCVEITSCDVTSVYNKERNKTYVNYLVFGIKEPDFNNKGSNVTNNKPAAKKPEVMDDDDDLQLPF